MKKKYLFLLLTAALAFASCDNNPAWSGPKPKEKADVLASQTCSCVYDMMGKEAGWDRDKIFEAAKAIAKINKGNLQEAVMSSDNPAISKAFESEDYFSLMMDDCDCMKPINDALLEQGVAFEDMMESLDLHCVVGAFYN